MRTGCRETEPPGAEVPDNGGGQQGEDHREPGAGADLQDQFDGEKRDDTESNRAGRGDDPGEIPEARPDDGDLRIHRVGVDDRGNGVRGVVESVDELKGERDEKRGAQENVRPRRENADASEVVSDAGSDEDEPADENACKNQGADFARLLVYLVMNRMLRRLLGGDGWRRRYRCCCSRGCC